MDHPVASDPRHWLDLKIPPPVIVLLLATGMWEIARLLTEPSLFWTPGRVILAAPLFMLGGLCGFGALGLFVQQRTSVNPHSPAAASSLIVTGIYRYTRNPMYLALLLALLGWSVLLATPITLLGPAVFFGYITRFQIKPEEHFLQERFGEDYATYCRQVRRWL